MLTACVLLACKSGQFVEVVKSALKIKGVRDAYPVLGRWDAVIWLNVPDNRSLDEATLKINSITGVRAIETMVAKTGEANP
ncbi:MAG: Lrp/AsnC ligand binding domain-containing protein [Candidatus Ranarchaeia archaeon]